MDDFQEKLKQRGLNFTVSGNTITVEPGKTVLCDFCDKDYTNSNAHGGILFQSKAVCPECTPKLLQDIEKYGEEDLIRARCPESLSFRDWVYTLR